MSRLNVTIREIEHIASLAERSQWMNQIHPLAKLVLTIIYIALLVSFSKYNTTGVLGMGIYLVAGFLLADLSLKDCVWRLRVILVLVSVVGIANPIFDKNLIDIGNVKVNAGIFSMLTLMEKGIFSVLAAYLLIATTSIEKICYSLRMLRVPKVFVLQLLLTYRYLFVLLEETKRTVQAYSLRAPKQKGIHFMAWGTFLGQLLLRSIQRSNQVYDSMKMRGFQMDFSYIGEECKIRGIDLAYVLIWILCLGLLRKLPVLELIGGWII